MDFGILLVVLLVALAIPNLLLVRKQKNHRNQVEAFQQSLAPGTQVVTAGGIHGTISAVDESTVMLEFAPGINLRCERSAVIREISS